MLAITLKLKDCVLIGDQVWQLKEICPDFTIFYVAQSQSIRLIKVSGMLRAVPYKNARHKTKINCRAVVHTSNRVRLYIDVEPTVRISRFGQYKDIKPA